MTGKCAIGNWTGVGSDGLIGHKYQTAGHTPRDCDGRNKGLKNRRWTWDAKYSADDY
jgi:hypothetical protein